MATVMQTSIFFLCILLAGIIGCTPAVDEEVPPFVGELIDQIKSEPKGNPPGSIWRYSYNGSVVFYVPSTCCDVSSVLYANDGTFICCPDGGITGKGDGKCPDFFETRIDEKRVWEDSR